MGLYRGSNFLILPGVWDCRVKIMETILVHLMEEKEQLKRLNSLKRIIRRIIRGSIIRVIMGV